MTSHDEKGGRKPSDTPPPRDKGDKSDGKVREKGHQEWSRDEPPKKPEPINRKVPPGHKP